MIISFPGGAGGNWLKCLIEDEPLNDVHIHFHEHKSKKQSVRLIHDVEVSTFDYLFSGDYYFNFFVNVIYKLFHNDFNFTAVRSYEDYYIECVDTARHICRFENIKNRIFFNFNELVHEDTKFYHSIMSVASGLNLSYLDFVSKKDLFFKTMVRTDDRYENFEDPIWVTFVLGQLMNHDIVPNDFSISDKHNQHLAADFAKQNYHHCKLNRVYHFDSNVILPNLLQID
jgi:hypothetical protein